MKDKLDNMINEFAKEITDFYTIVIKDGNRPRRFSFDIKNLKNLESELSKNFGTRIVKGVMSEINQAIEGNYLKNFAVDDSVDFEVNGDKLITRIRQKDRVVAEDIATEYVKGLGTVKLYTADKLIIGFIKLDDLLKSKFNMFKYHDPLPGGVNNKTIVGHLSLIKGVLEKSADKFKGDDGNFDLIYSAGKLTKMTPDA